MNTEVYKKSAELYKRYRPKTLRELVGQDKAIRSFEKMMAQGQVPHAILLTGPSGVGKTTIARILKTQLRCADNDFFERNCADFRGVDDIREMRRHVNLSPLGGRCRLWLIDECHKLTNDAQNALLKLLEDTPTHIYYVLCTTEPQKLIKTIHTRCTLLKLEAIKSEDLLGLCKEIATKEEMKVSKDVLEELVEAAEGSARKALVMLEQVGILDDTKDQLRAISSIAFNKDKTIELARTLLFGNGNWNEIAALLRAVAEEDAEGIRYCILGYARAILVGKDDKSPNPKFAAKAHMVIDLFSRNFYDSKHAGLAAACWEATQQD